MQYQPGRKGRKRLVRKHGPREEETIPRRSPACGEHPEAPWFHLTLQTGRVPEVRSRCDPEEKGKVRREKPRAGRKGVRSMADLLPFTGRL